MKVKTLPTQCPFIDQEEYICDKPKCAGCDIWAEALAKINEAREIADNMKDYWIESADGVER